MLKNLKQKILIVDDTPSNILFLTEVLKDQEFEIYAAGNGAEAIDIANSEHPDLILLDVIMKDMDGYEVCQQLKAGANTSNIPIIFITAYEDEDDEAYGLQLGAADYITKPVNPAIVIARVRNHLALKKQQDLMEAISSTDFMTGVANRRRFDEVIESELRRNTRIHKPLTLVMCDVDYFKQYNDLYNHLAGDLCLKHIAKALENIFHRAGDLVARYGGEEFVIILPNTDSDTALQMAKTLCEKIEALNIPHSNSSVSKYVTLSAGVATWADGETQLSAQSLIEASDQALYQAKHNGRNRVEMAEVIHQ